MKVGAGRLHCASRTTRRLPCGDGACPPGPDPDLDEAPAFSSTEIHAADQSNRRAVKSERRKAASLGLEKGPGIGGLPELGRVGSVDPTRGRRRFSETDVWDSEPRLATVMRVRGRSDRGVEREGVASILNAPRFTRSPSCLWHLPLRGDTLLLPAPRPSGLTPRRHDPGESGV